jgi:hypothetical protein
MKLTTTEKDRIRKFVNNGEAGILLMNVSHRDIYFFDSFDRDENGRLIKEYDHYKGCKDYLWSGTFGSPLEEYCLENYEWCYDGRTCEFHSCSSLMEELKELRRLEYTRMMKVEEEWNEKTKLQNENNRT